MDCVFAGSVVDCGSQDGVRSATFVHPYTKVVVWDGMGVK